jgi:WD40 repeat protein
MNDSKHHWMRLGLLAWLVLAILACTTTGESSSEPEVGNITEQPPQELGSDEGVSRGKGILTVMSFPFDGLDVHILPEDVAFDAEDQLALVTEDNLVGTTPLEMELPFGAYRVVVMHPEMPIDCLPDGERSILEVATEQGSRPVGRTYTASLNEEDDEVFVTSLFWSQSRTLAEFVSSLPDEELWEIDDGEMGHFTENFRYNAVPPEDQLLLLEMFRKTGKMVWYSEDFTEHLFMWRWGPYGLGQDDHSEVAVYATQAPPSQPNAMTIRVEPITLPGTTYGPDVSARIEALIAEGVPAEWLDPAFPAHYEMMIVPRIIEGRACDYEGGVTLIPNQIVIDVKLKFLDTGETITKRSFQGQSANCPDPIMAQAGSTLHSYGEIEAIHSDFSPWLRSVIYVHQSDLSAENGGMVMHLDHPGTVYSVEYSPDGSLIVTTAWDWAIRLWSAETGALLKTIEDQTYPNASIHADGHSIALGATSGYILVRDMESDQTILEIGAYLDGQFARSVELLTYSPDGDRILSVGSNEGLVRIWDAITGEQLVELEEPIDRMGSATFSPDGRFVLTSDEGEYKTTRVWDAQTGKLSLEVVSGGWVEDAFYDTSGQVIVTVGPDGMIRMWDAASGEEIRRFDRSFPDEAVISPDGQLMVVLNSEKISLWNVRTGEEITTLVDTGVRSVSTHLAYSPDGQRVAFSTENIVWVWDVAEG